MDTETISSLHKFNQECKKCCFYVSVVVVVVVVVVVAITVTMS